MNLRHSESDLRAAWSLLQSTWAQSRTEWRDSVGDQFEKENWTEWERAIPAYLDALEELLLALEKSRQQE